MSTNRLQNLEHSAWGVLRASSLHRPVVRCVALLSGLPRFLFATQRQALSVPHSRADGVRGERGRQSRTGLVLPSRARFAASAVRWDMAVIRGLCAMGPSGRSGHLRFAAASRLPGYSIAVTGIRSLSFLPESDSPWNSLSPCSPVGLPVARGPRAERLRWVATSSGVLLAPYIRTLEGTYY